MIPLQLSETELRELKDNLYLRAKQGERDFKGLLEIITCRENLIHAIRKVKSNSGFNTAGTDNMKGEDLLQGEVEEIFTILENCFEDYNPKAIKRVYIPKRNGKLRPLGIPTVIDRIVQTAIANVIEPILEAQFYEHSYGFRPMRQIEHAYGYISTLVNTSNRYWVVEGDIKGFFDNVDHNILINKLYKYGIRDKRLLQIIKKILKSGIEKEKPTNELGTPQGGTLSPLLANVYLTDFDKWVDGQWRNFKTIHKYSKQGSKISKLKGTNLKQGYLVRYADDWIILTDSEDSAIKWKYAAKKYLKEKLKLELSDEKTKITDISVNQVSFLGIDFWVSKGSKGKMTLRSRPNPERIKTEMKSIYEKLKEIRQASNDCQLTERVLNYNSVVRGVNNFYRITTMYNPVLGKEEWRMKDALLRTERKTKLSRIKTKNCPNLTQVNKAYLYSKSTTLAIKIGDSYIGLEKVGFGRFKAPRVKAQWINPYSKEGRAKYEEITGNKWQTFARNPWLTLGDFSSLIAKNSKKDKIYNLEYFINRPMAFNRDKGQCRVCKKKLTGNGDTNIHHKNKELPLNQVNKLNNLVTLCLNCHYTTHKKVKKSNHTNSTKKVSRSKVKPPKDVLLQDITTMPMTKVGAKYGVSDNAAKKWAISYGIWEQRMNKCPRKTNT